MRAFIKQNKIRQIGTFIDLRSTTEVLYGKGGTQGAASRMAATSPGGELIPATTTTTTTTTTVGAASRDAVGEMEDTVNFILAKFSRILAERDCAKFNVESLEWKNKSEAEQERQQQQKQRLTTNQQSLQKQQLLVANNKQFPRLEETNQQLPRQRLMTNQTHSQQHLSSNHQLSPQQVPHPSVNQLQQQLQTQWPKSIISGWLEAKVDTKTHPTLQQQRTSLSLLPMLDNKELISTGPEDSCSRSGNNDERLERLREQVKRLETKVDMRERSLQQLMMKDDASGGHH